VIEIGSDVQREAVARNPAADPNADGRELFLTSRRADPHASQTWHAHTRHTKRSDGLDEHLFEVPHVAVDVAAIRLEIENRIPDELTGTVIRDVAASARVEDADSGRRQDVG
jgi:hypothetical protein